MKKQEYKITMSKDGTKYWRLLNGKVHREDGPAVEWENGTKEWWLNGIWYQTQQDWLIALRPLKLKIILNSQLS